MQPSGDFCITCDKTHRRTCEDMSRAKLLLSLKDANSKFKEETWNPEWQEIAEDLLKNVLNGRGLVLSGMCKSRQIDTVSSVGIEVKQTGP